MVNAQTMIEQVQKDEEKIRNEPKMTHKELASFKKAADGAQGKHKL